MENVGIFYDHLVYFMAIGNTLWPIGIFCGHLVYFPCFGMLYEEKSGNPETVPKICVKSLPRNRQESHLSEASLEDISSAKTLKEF
jgi:hypothetical protein